MKYSSSLTALLLATSCFVPRSAPAHDLLFSYLYLANTAPKGEVELENWVTWKTGFVGDRSSHTVEFRHEVEWGVTDRLQLSLYVADWDYQSRGADHGFHYQDSAIEAIYNLTDPEKSWLGSSIYGEIRGGDKDFELESKVLVQKNFGPFVAAYNAGLEAVWEGDSFGSWSERTGEFTQAVGLSYRIDNHISCGAEVMHEIEWPGWGKPERSRVFAGPNVAGHYGSLRATLTPLFQLTDRTGEPAFQLRMIFGVEF